MVITLPSPDCGRPLTDVVEDCLRAGATTIQLRDKTADARALAETGRALRESTSRAGALLIVNDRLDLALAIGADGVHLGPDDLPVGAARAIVPPTFLVGYSTDDPQRAATAAGEGASYLGVGAVYGTRSKPGLADEAIGPERVRQVLDAAALPGVGIGGITAANAGAVFATGAGVAVISTVMCAPEPARAVASLLEVLPGCENAP